MDKKLVALLIISVLVLGFVALIGVNSSQTGYGIFDTMMKILRGGSKKPPKGGGGYGSCYVLPNPVPVQANLTIYGSGFKSNQGLVLNLLNSGGSLFRWVTTDTTGKFTTVWWTYAVGANTIKISDTATQAFLTNCSFSGI